MRRLGWITLFVVLAFAFGATIFQPQTTLAESKEPVQRTLDVVGRGTLTVKYDTAQIQLGFSALEPDAAKAYHAMGASMDGVVASLKKAGVKEDDLKTGMFTLYEEYDYTQNGRMFKGYRIENSLTVTTRDLTKIGDLIQVAVTAGANRLQGVTFSVKETDKLLDQALDLAVEDAKAKAERVAGKLGAKVAGVYRISIQDGGRSAVMYEAPMGGSADAGAKAPMAVPQVFSGTGEYTATVSVTFELQ